MTSIEDLLKQPLWDKPKPGEEWTPPEEVKSGSVHQSDTSVNQERHSAPRDVVK